MKNLLCLALLLIFSTAVFASEQTPKSNWAKFGVNKIHYYDVGSKKNKDTIVFVHGWTCTADFWRGQIRAFPKMRVVAIDLLGHGRSDKPETQYSMEFFAKAIESVMNHAKIERAVLVGHSMGTPVIRQFYRLYPQKTAGLVIVDGALRPMASKEAMAGYIGMMRANYQETAPRMVDGMLQPIKDDKLKQEIRSSMLATPEFVALSAMEGMADEKNWTNDKINVPVLALMAKSPVWASDTEQFYRTMAPNLEFQMWDGASHFLMMEQPAKFNSALQAFLAGNKLAKN